jgi:hypothetical protein
MRRCAVAALLLLCGSAIAGQGAESGPSGAALGLRSGVELAPIFARQVKPRLTLPPTERTLYARLLEAALAKANVALTGPQYVLLVDRSPKVQAALVYWRDGDGVMHLIGASRVSTGRPGGYEYFLTPLGVFEHSIAHPDFRAEGTLNELGVRGYGVEGMRVFDFGWVIGERTWGEGGRSPMRLQVHATDPDVLEPRLGAAASKGCIRISASLNQFLDSYGLLDADYEAVRERGVPLWVLRKDRTPTPWSGRFLVVVESERTRRPPWASWSPNDRAGRESKGRPRLSPAPLRRIEPYPPAPRVTSRAGDASPLRPLPPVAPTADAWP